MICPKCGTIMKNILHFESNKNYQYNICVHCYQETKHKRIHFDDIIPEKK